MKQKIDSLSLVASKQKDSSLISTWIRLSISLVRLNPNQADSIAQLAEAHSDSLGLSQLKMNALAQRGQIQFATSNLNEAINYFKEALDIASAIPDSSQMCSMQYNISIAYRKIGIYDKALEYGFKAIDYYSYRGDIKAMSNAFNNIALVYKSNSNFDNAHTYFKKSLNLRLVSENYKEIAGSYNNIGLVHKAQKNYHTAKGYYSKALKIADSLKLKHYKASIYNNLSNVHFLTDSLEQAQKCAILALNYARLTRRKLSVSTAYYNIANCFTKANKLDKAYESSLKAYTASLEASSLAHQSTILNQLVEITETSGKIAASLDYLKRLKMVDDSIKSLSISQRITEQRLQYEFDKKIDKQEKLRLLENIKSEHELQNQKITNWLILTILAMAIVALGFIAIHFRRSIKHKKKLEEQNQRISQQAEEMMVQADFLSEANQLITQQKEEIEEQHRHFTDNINYARQIQIAISPQPEELSEKVSDHFYINLPKDIVSGDFFWCKTMKRYTAFAVSDCTGHGVSAGFLTMLGLTYLEDIVLDMFSKGNIDAGKILTQLRSKVKSSLSESQKAKTQGMDIALCIIDHQEETFQFSGANNSMLWFKQKGGSFELEEIKADRMPIGSQPKERPEFKNHVRQLRTGDWIYLFSDGYIDQFGGIQGHKYLKKRFKNYLSNIVDKTGDEQKEDLLNELSGWMKGRYKQIDDISVLGIKL